MTLGQHQEAFSSDFCKLLNYLHDNGYKVRCGELERTKAQQEIYFKEGKSKTMNSNHLKRCAVDLHIFKNGNWLMTKADLQEIGDYWESLSPENRWGGNFRSFVDTPHFERNV
ncbi:M15 family metallopeptidase [Campylobacter sp. RM16191]|uniref:M15 family metallopeptidase n=1 Tax=Campylobacter sp. RM16191 TaxID=1705728 RepID=UPI0014757F10|nr:M15 family metallopeptidase [Campylobacter sp. RM16191]